MENSKHDNSNFWKPGTSQQKNRSSYLFLLSPKVFLQFFRHRILASWSHWLSRTVGGRCSSCHLGGCLTMHCTPGAADVGTCGLPSGGRNGSGSFTKLPLGSEGTQKKTKHVLLEVVSICLKWIHYHESMIVCINLFDSSDIVHRCTSFWWESLSHIFDRGCVRGYLFVHVHTTQEVQPWEPFILVTFAVLKTVLSLFMLLIICLFFSMLSVWTILCVSFWVVVKPWTIFVQQRCGGPSSNTSCCCLATTPEGACNSSRSGWILTWWTWTRWFNVTFWSPVGGHS